MSTPKLVKFSITDSEKETAICLLQDMTVKQIAASRDLSFEGVQSQTKRIRVKMQATTIYGALLRMIATGVITKDELASCVPKNLLDKF